MTDGLQQKLVSLSEYNVSFEVANGKFVIRLSYPENWTVISPMNEGVELFKDEKVDNVFYYVSSMTTDMNALFAAVDDTISYNKELEEKTELLKKMVEELQEIFVKEPISVLKTLKFEMKKAKEKKKAAPKKKESVEERTVKEEPKFEEEVNEQETDTVPSDIDKKIEEAIKSKSKKK